MICFDLFSFTFLHFERLWFFLSFRQALMYFPSQLPQLLRLAGYADIPENHPFKGKETLVSLGGLLLLRTVGEC